MEEKLNIAEILKDAPNNTRLYSPIYGIVRFDRLRTDLYGRYDSEKKIHYCVGYSEFTDDEIIPYEDNEDKLGTLIETK